MIEAAAYVMSMDEKSFQRVVVEAATLYGWMVVHIRNMISNRSGIPDLLMYRGDRYLLAEIKTERGKVSPRQSAWHEEAALSGVRVHVWRPSDWSAIERALRADAA